jgi:uncharacterized protein YciI
MAPPRKERQTQGGDRIRANNRGAWKACQRPPPESRGPEKGAPHRAYLERLAAAGVVLLFGRTQTTDTATLGIVIFRAGSSDEAQQVMDDDPAVRARVMRGEVFPFRVVGVGSGLSTRARSGPAAPRPA